VSKCNYKSVTVCLISVGRGVRGSGGGGPGGSCYMYHGDARTFDREVSLYVNEQRNLELCDVHVSG